MVVCKSGGGVVQAESVAEAGSCVSEAQMRTGRPGQVGCESGGGVVQGESAAEADSCVSEALAVNECLSGANPA
jgi:hypothetical protein